MKIFTPSQTSLPADLFDPARKSLYLTAPHSGSGTTSCALALAQYLSNLSQKVVLIDGNPRSSSLTQQLHLADQPGFSDYLAAMDQDVSKLLFPFEAEQFHILPVGKQDSPLPPGVHLLEKMAEILEQLTQSFDCILYDAPAVFSEDCELTLASVFQGAVLIVSNNTRWQVALGAKEQFVKMNVKLLGTIFNRRRYHIPEWLYRLL